MELGLELQQVFLDALKKLQGEAWDGAQARIAVAVSVALSQRYPMLNEVELLGLVHDHVTVDADKISIDAVAVAEVLLERGDAADGSSVPPTDPAPPTSHV
jgi:hypothetical protein